MGASCSCELIAGLVVGVGDGNQAEADCCKFKRMKQDTPHEVLQFDLILGDPLGLAFPELLTASQYWLGALRG